MEKKYFKTLHLDDKSAYDEADNKARSLVIQARVESIKDELENFLNPQMLPRKLISFFYRQKHQHNNDDECAAHLQSFNSFLLGKVMETHNNIKSGLSDSNSIKTQLIHIGQTQTLYKVVLTTSLHLMLSKL